MIDFALKNMKRRKTRTFLTALGIIIGITAIVALGSVSEGLNLMVNEQLGALAGKVIIMEAGLDMVSGYSSSDITDEQLEMIRDMPGVEEAAPVIFYIPPFGAGQGLPSFQIIGVEPKQLDVLIGKNIETGEGRKLEDGDREVGVIGHLLEENLDLRVGDFWTFRDIDFEIVGILEETGTTDFDMGFMVPIEDMQEALETDNYQIVYAVLEDPDEAEEFAERVEDNDDSLSALTLTEITRQISGILDQVSLFTLGIGAVAALVGGLGVLNTMMMAVMERKREIGVMKAIGATRRFVIMQVLIESCLLSLLGGLVGIFLGWIASFGLGMLTGGMINAAVTPALALGSLGFAVLLGFLGGLYPARKAAGMDPVEALRG